MILIKFHGGTESCLFNTLPSLKQKHSMDGWQLIIPTSKAIIGKILTRHLYNHAFASYFRIWDSLTNRTTFSMILSRPTMATSLFSIYTLGFRGIMFNFVFLYIYIFNLKRKILCKRFYVMWMDVLPACIVYI